MRCRHESQAWKIRRATVSPVLVVREPRLPSVVAVESAIGLKRISSRTGEENYASDSAQSMNMHSCRTSSRTDRLSRDHYSTSMSSREVCRVCFLSVPEAIASCGLRPLRSVGVDALAYRHTGGSIDPMHFVILD